MDVAGIDDHIHYYRVVIPSKASIFQKFSLGNLYGAHYHWFSDLGKNIPFGLSGRANFIYQLLHKQNHLNYRNRLPGLIL